MGRGGSAQSCKNYLDIPEGERHELGSRWRRVCKDMCPDFPDKEKCNFDEIIKFYNEEPRAKGCSYSLCDHWTWDGDGSCWSGLTGNYNNTCSNSESHGTPVLGGHGCNSSSYRISGCEDHEILGYYQTHHQGNPAVFRAPKGDLWENNLRSVKITEIPRRIWKYILVNTDGECPGAAVTYKRVVGKKNACFYQDHDDSALRTLQSGGSASAHVDAKEKFCKLSKNVFKNPGGGICLEYDTAKTLAKEYCSVGARIKTDGACTKNNLGNHYTGVVDAYCSTAAGKSDMWCSCLHAKKGRCDLPNASEFAGCDDVNKAHNELIEDIPEDSLSGGVRQQLKERKHCRAKICSNPDAYIPDKAMDNCALNLQVCVQDVQVAGHLVDSGIDVSCNQEQGGSGGGDVEKSKGKRNDYAKGGGGGDSKKNFTTFAFGGAGLSSSMACMSCVLLLVVMSSSS